MERDGENECTRRQSEVQSEVPSHAGAMSGDHLHARKSSSLTRLARSVSPAVEPPARRRRRRHVLLLGGGVSASSARSD